MNRTECLDQVADYIGYKPEQFMVLFRVTDQVAWAVIERGRIEVP